MRSPHFVPLSRQAVAILRESSLWRNDAIERQLAHTEKDEIRAVYSSAQYLPERRELMQCWADRLDALASMENIVSMQRRAMPSEAAT